MYLFYNRLLWELKFSETENFLNFKALESEESERGGEKVLYVSKTKKNFVVLAFKGVLKRTDYQEGTQLIPNGGGIKIKQ